jgi:excisionase family DNA binding protein
MHHSLRVSGTQTSGGERDTVTNSLLDVQQVAEILGISTRTVRRLADRGVMPRPVKLGALLRWPAETGDPMTGIHDWITAGCPTIGRGCSRMQKGGRS